MRRIKKTKQAFTLAETLISLTIIGVIAAITVHVLIAKQNDEALKSQFKKAYSTLSQALNQTIVMDFAGSAECYYPINSAWGAVRTDCIELYDKFFQKLNLVKKCSSKAKEGGCVPKYQNYITKSGCEGLFENQINNTNPAFVLADGMIIIGYNPFNAPIFDVDINGFKGPNRLGYDLFTFAFFKTNDGALKIGAYVGCADAFTGGRKTQDMMKYALLGS